MLFLSTFASSCYYCSYFSVIRYLNVYTRSKILTVIVEKHVSRLIKIYVFLKRQIALSKFQHATQTYVKNT